MSIQIINNNPLKRNFLLEKYLKGMANKEKLSLEKFYKYTKNSIYAYILSMIKNKHDAEDLLHEFYLKVYENANKYKSHAKPMAWLLTIARNLCYEKYRSKKEIFNIDDYIELGDYDKNHKKVEDKIVIDVLFNMISDEERIIIMLYAVSGLKHREIANYLDMPLSTILSKYNRAIKKLKESFKEDIR